MKLVYTDVKHSYWLDGVRTKSASKVAQIAADSYTIEQWQQRQITIGMTLEPTLTEKVAVDLENRDAIQLVCEQAKETAKSNARANRGTQRHRVFELLLLGEHSRLVTDQQRADAVVLQRTLDAYGLTPMPDRVEQFIAYPDHGVTGRYDAILMHEGRPVLVDLKGGENAVKYPHSTIVQFALYAFAPLTSAAIERDGDRSTVTEWTTMPADLDLEAGYVIYCDDHHDVGELWRVDLTHGRAAAELALQIVDWRKTKNYGRSAVSKISAVDRSTADEPAAIPLAAEATPAATHSAEGAAAGVDHRSPVVKTISGYLNVSQQWLAALNAAHQPPPHRRPDEGPGVDDADFAPLQAAYKALPAEAQAWCVRLLDEADAGNVRFHAKGARTLRRFELYRGMIYLAGWLDGGGDDEVLMALVYGATQGDDAVRFANIAAGHALGSLDHVEAARFAALVDQLADGRAHTVANFETGALELVAV